MYGGRRADGVTTRLAGLLPAFLPLLPALEPARGNEVFVAAFLAPLLRCVDAAAWTPALQAAVTAAIVELVTGARAVAWMEHAASTAGGGAARDAAGGSGIAAVGAMCGALVALIDADAAGGLPFDATSRGMLGDALLGAASRCTSDAVLRPPANSLPAATDAVADASHVGALLLLAAAAVIAPSSQALSPPPMPPSTSSHAPPPALTLHTAEGSFIDGRPLPRQLWQAVEPLLGARGAHPLLRAAATEACARVASDVPRSRGRAVTAVVAALRTSVGALLQDAGEARVEEDDMGAALAMQALIETQLSAVVDLVSQVAGTPDGPIHTAAAMDAVREAISACDGRGSGHHGGAAGSHVLGGGALGAGGVRHGFRTGAGGGGPSGSGGSGALAAGRSRAARLAEQLRAVTKASRPAPATASPPSVAPPPLPLPSSLRPAGSAATSVAPAVAILRHALLAALTLLMSRELAGGGGGGTVNPGHAHPHAAHTEPATPLEGAAAAAAAAGTGGFGGRAAPPSFFETSATRTQLYSLAREATAALEASHVAVAEGDGGSAGGSGGGGSSGGGGAAASAAAPAAPSPPVGAPAGSAAALAARDAAARAVHLVHTLRHIARACNTAAVTDAVATTLLEMFTAEREWQQGVVARALTGGAKVATLRALWPFSSDGGAGAGGRHAGGRGGAAAAPAAAPKRSMLDWLFGGSGAGGVAGAGAPTGSGGGVAPPSGQAAAATGTNATATAASRSTFAAVVLALADTLALRTSTKTFAAVMDTLASSLASSHAAAAAAAATVTAATASLPPAAAATLAAAVVDGSTLPGALAHAAVSLRNRAACGGDAAAEWEGRRADFRHRLLVLLARIASESATAAAGAAAAAGGSAGVRAVESARFVQRAGTLSSLMPALAHALVPHAAAPEGSAHGRGGGEAAGGQAVRGRAGGVGGGAPAGGARRGGEAGGASVATSLPPLRARDLLVPPSSHGSSSRGGASHPLWLAALLNGWRAPAASSVAPPHGVPARADATSAASLLHAALARALAPAYSAPQRSSASGVRMFRNLWVHLVLARLTEPGSGVWPAHVYRAVRCAAVHTPVLVVRAPGSYVDLELSSTAYLRAPLADATLVEFRDTLTAYLPDAAAVIAALSTPHLIFMRTVFAVEVLRGTAGCCRLPLRASVTCARTPTHPQNPYRCSHRWVVQGRLPVPDGYCGGAGGPGAGGGGGG